ncbi:MAG: 4-alpha-glucanotransferase [Desulfomonile sp.]|nr:4-alpha-glucanotransferase [Desulfomonile sp.]
MSPTHDQLLALAQAFGLEPSYTDNWGELHIADVPVALQFLAEKGVTVEVAHAEPEPDTLVVSVGAEPDRFSLTFPADRPDAHKSKSISCEIKVEAVEQGGESCAFALKAEELTVELDRPARCLHVGVPFPHGLQPGVYRVTAQARQEKWAATSSAWWLVCPTVAYEPPELREGRKIAGIGLALYGLRSRRNWGIGDFTDLRHFVEWARSDLGVDAIGINPLHALFNRKPYHTSPYLPSSRLFRNFIYLDVENVPEFQDSRGAKTLVSRPDIRRTIEHLREREHVAYEEVAALKRDVLREAFHTFLQNRNNQRWDEFRAYRQAEGTYLENYAIFCALDEHFRTSNLQCRSWRDWPAAYRDPTSSAVAEFRRHHENEVLFHMYLQWQIEEQLSAVQRAARDKGMIVGLYHDLALGSDRDGADFWALQRFFHAGFSAGAPPDAFSPHGQDWGFSPPNREAMRKAGYEPFLKDLRANCKHGGALRIDHVMKLHRLFWIPRGCKPQDGVYVKDYEADLLNALVLESQRNRTIIIGEDLGTVPFDLRLRLMAKRVYSYRLFYFERDDQGNQLPCHSYPPDALVSVSTHDLPTLAGFWSGRDIDLRIAVGHVEKEREQGLREERANHKAKIIERLVRHGHLPADRAHRAWIETSPTEDLHAAVLDFLFRTPSKIALINQEDLFLDDRQQNLPGTTTEHPNWVTKMRYTVEELRANPEARRCAERFYGLASLCGRVTR